MYDTIQRPLGTLYAVPFSVGTPGTANPFLAVRCSRASANKVSLVSLDLIAGAALDVLVKRITMPAAQVGTAITPAPLRAVNGPAATLGLIAGHSFADTGVAVDALDTIPYANGVPRLHDFTLTPRESEQPKKFWTVTISGITDNDADVVIHRAQRNRTFRFHATPPADTEDIFGVVTEVDGPTSAANLEAKMKAVQNSSKDISRSAGVLTIREEAFEGVTNITEAGDGGADIAIVDGDVAPGPEWLAFYSSANNSVKGTLVVEVSRRVR